MQKFIVSIGVKHAPPRIKLEVYAPDAVTALIQHEDMRQGHERIDVWPVPTQEEYLQADIERDTDKARKLFRREEAYACEAQRIYLRAIGVGS
jgi:hypothetical protein